MPAIAVAEKDVTQNGQITATELMGFKNGDLSKAEQAVVARFNHALVDGDIGHVIGTHKVPMLAGPDRSDYWEATDPTYAITKQDLENLSKK